MFLIHEEKTILQKNFAQAYTKDDAEIAIKKLDDYIKQPTQNKLYHRPLLDFQIIYGQINEIFYLFVTDLADRFKYVEEEIKKLSKRIISIKKPITEIINDKDSKLLLEGYLQELHENLHPKISFAGPMGAGKTSLVQILSIKEIAPKEIMTFALVHKSKIQDLTFDMWDFREGDFSPLWNNYIRGSDLIIVNFDATNISDKKVSHFFNLCKREGKYSKVLVLLSHSGLPDAIDAARFKEQFGDMINAKIECYDLNDVNVAGEVRSFIIEALMLKKPLPSNFRNLLISANTEITKGNYPSAIAKLKELLKIAEEYQETTYANTFKTKITELEQKWKEQKKQKEIEARKIKAPEKKVFNQSVKIKALPSKQTKALKPKVSSPKPLPKPVQKPIINKIDVPNKELNVEKATPKAKPMPPAPKEPFSFKKSPLVKDEIVRKPIKQPTPLKPSNLSPSVEIPSTSGKPQTSIDGEKYKKIDEENRQSQQKNLHSIFSPKPTETTGKSEMDQKEQKLKKEIDILDQKIKEAGKELRLDLCKKFIIQIRQKLNKDELNEKDIEMAAKLYIKRLEH